MKKNVNWSLFHTNFWESYIKINVPQEAGLYLIWLKLHDSTWSCIYVGHSIDIRAQLIQHLKQSSQNYCLRDNLMNYVCGFEFALVKSKEEREGMEKFLIEFYSPTCNQKYNSNSLSIEINLPSDSL